MKRTDIVDLLLLAALWGAAFLFTKIAAPEFGAIPLAGLRVTGAVAVLLPLLLMRRESAALAPNWRPLLAVGFTTSAFPFACYSFAALTITSGLSSIFNAAAPLFAAVIAWFWLKDKLSALRVLGLVIGFFGVFGLAYSKAGLKSGSGGDLATALAIGACLLATVSYGYSANFTKRFLTGVPPMAVAAGSQLFATLLLAVPTVLLWPATPPSLLAWGSVIALSVLSTGVAYILFFRLIANVGPSNAIAVTFLIPVFAMAWGALFLGETPTSAMLIGCAVILVGTALATGLVSQRRRS